MFVRAAKFEIQTSAGDRRCQLNRGGKRTLNPLTKEIVGTRMRNSFAFRAGRIRLIQFPQASTEFRAAVYLFR